MNEGSRVHTQLGTGTFEIKEKKFGPDETLGWVWVTEVAGNALREIWILREAVNGAKLPPDKNIEFEALEDDVFDDAADFEAFARGRLKEGETATHYDHSVEVTSGWSLTSESARAPRPSPPAASPSQRKQLGTGTFEIWAGEAEIGWVWSSADSPYEAWVLDNADPAAGSVPKGTDLQFRDTTETHGNRADFEVYATQKLGLTGRGTLYFLLGHKERTNFPES